MTAHINELVIFAFDDVFQATGADIKLMQELEAKLPNVFIKESLGYWEGITERSWVVSAPVWDAIKAGHEPMVRAQVCILRVPTDGKNKGYLEYPDGSIETVGYLRETDETTALKAGAYTKMGGKYYVASDE